MTNDLSTPVWVVIPAAGLGQRMDSELPKQYLKIYNKTLLEHTLNCFSEHNQVAGIVVVLNEQDTFFSSLDLKSFPKQIRTVIGGESRSDSVFKGLNYLSEDLNILENSWVLVHDAARPCLTMDDIDALLAIRSKTCVGGILASPVKDTMKRSSAFDCESDLTNVSKTESRDNLWHALTPQMFRLNELLDALAFCNKNTLIITDESSAMEAKGFSPLIIEGSHNNIKITYPSDIEMVSFLLKNRVN